MRLFTLLLFVAPAAFAGDREFTCDVNEMNAIARRRHASGGVDDHLGAGASTPWAKALHNADENTARFVTEHATPAVDVAKTADEDKLDADLARLQGIATNHAVVKTASGTRYSLVETGEAAKVRAETEHTIAFGVVESKYANDTARAKKMADDLAAIREMIESNYGSANTEDIQQHLAYRNWSKEEIKNCFVTELCSPGFADKALAPLKAAEEAAIAAKVRAATEHAIAYGVVESKYAGDSPRVKKMADDLAAIREMIVSNYGSANTEDIQQHLAYRNWSKEEIKNCFVTRLCDPQFEADMKASFAGAAEAAKARATVEAARLQESWNSSRPNYSARRKNGPAPFATVHGAPIFTKQAMEQLEQSKPAVAAAVRYRDAADDMLGANLREYLSGKTSESRIKELESKFGYPAGPVVGLDEASRRADYLRQYRDILNRQAARARAEGKPSRAASYETARDAVGAQLAGVLRDRSDALAKGGKASRAQALKVLASEEAYLPYRRQLGGRTLAQTLADPEAAKLLSSLKARDAARDAAAAAEAQASLEKTVAQKIALGSGEARAKKMANDLVDIHNIHFYKVDSWAAYRANVEEALKKHGWDSAEMNRCFDSKLCVPWNVFDVGVNKYDSPETYGLLFRESLAKADPEVAREARDIAESEPARSLAGRSPDEILNDLRDQRVEAQGQASSLRDYAANSPGVPGLDHAARLADRAEDVAVERLNEATNNAALLKDLRRTEADAPLTDRAAEAVMDFQKTADESALAKIDPSLEGLSAKGVDSAEKRAALYEKLTGAVAALPVEKRAAVFDAVAEHAKQVGDDFGKGLDAGSKKSGASIATALTRADQLADAIGHDGGVAAHAAYRDAHLNGHEQALADALHASRDRVPGVKEAAREMKAEAKAADAERVAATKTMDRAPASVATAPELEKLAYQKFSTLPNNDRVVLTQALANIATKDMDRAQRTLQHLEALEKSSPDTFELYRVSLTAAANEFAAGGKDWNTAWEDGVKFMLKDSGIPESEYMDKAHANYFKKTARCLGV